MQADESTVRVRLEKTSPGVSEESADPWAHGGAQMGMLWRPSGPRRLILARHPSSEPAEETRSGEVPIARPALFCWCYCLPKEPGVKVDSLGLSSQMSK